MTTVSTTTTTTTFRGAVARVMEHVRRVVPPTLPGLAPLLSQSQSVDAMVYDPEEALDTPFHVEALGAALTWSVMVAAHGRVPPHAIDANRVALGLRGERYLRMEGRAVDMWDPLAGVYELRDGSRVQLHTNFLHHRDAALRALGLAPWPATNSSTPVKEAVRRFPGSAEQLAERVLDHGGAAAAVVARPPTEWPPGVEWHLLEVERVCDGPRVPFDLSQTRVMDTTRVLAGPSATQILADLGCDVVQVTKPGLPQFEPTRLMMGRGKRSATWSGDRVDDLLGVVRGADVWMRSARPDASVSRVDVHAAAAAAAAPTTVVVDIQAYLPHGPHPTRRGYDSLVQCASGLYALQTEWQDGAPGHLPVQALDHCGGFLATLGALIALRRRETEGGGFRVRVSLEGIATLLRVGLRRAEPRVRHGLSRLEARLVAGALVRASLDDGRVLEFIPNAFFRPTTGVIESVMGSSRPLSQPWAQPRSPSSPSPTSRL